MKRVHRVLGLLLLLAYAGGATSVVPVVFAALAAIDGSHRIVVCPTEEGTQIRLHHREDDFTPEVCDHAGMLGRFVVSFCRPATEGDHSLSTREVAGGLSSQDDETERLIKGKDSKDKPCSGLPGVEFSGRFAWVPRMTGDKVVLRAERDRTDAGGGEMLRRMATVRLLI
ncbi:hypothetical protein [Prosthecobacter sp.]|uniref:hypothetical protein n=1 Tax=Prosthecobacter sp. TaxID=1965333 RepID=UPI0037840C4A